MMVKDNVILRKRIGYKYNQYYKIALGCAPDYDNFVVETCVEFHIYWYSVREQNFSVIYSDLLYQTHF